MANDLSRQHLFISHHHKDDGIVDKFTDLIGRRGQDVRNSSIRVNPDNQARLDKRLVSDETIKRLLRRKIRWSSTVIVLIGKETSTRPWVNWEIEIANKMGKPIIGVFERGGTENDIPDSLKKYATSINPWNSDSVLSAINGKYDFQKPDGSQLPNIYGAARTEC